jgi:hypothetical protein
MLYSGQADLGAWIAKEHRKMPLYPNYGNGYLGGFLGCFTQDHDVKRVLRNGGEGPTATAGVIHVGGIFSGKNTGSMRAEIPGIFSLYPITAAIDSKDGERNEASPVAFGGSALDLTRGVFTNRTKVDGCGKGAVIEQRWYAHRAIRSLLVYELELMTGSGDVPSGDCTITFASCNGDATTITSTNTTIISTTQEVVSSLSVTISPETQNTSLATVARVFKQPKTAMAIAAGPTNQQRFLAVLKTSLPEEEVENLLPGTEHENLAADDAVAVTDPLAAATALYKSIIANETAVLATHEQAWAELHSSRIELGGDRGDETAAAVAVAVNSSMYYLLSAAREDWPFSTSPGGLANNAYLGKHPIPCTRLLTIGQLSFTTL